MKLPKNPAIYHIVHVDNLASIVHEGCLHSDVAVRRRGLTVRGIGYSHIKQRRLTRAVPVAARGMLGEYVPFNFCSRSVMLYVVGRGHNDYEGGQAGIVHLVSSFDRAVATGQQCAFTDRHAELGHALYYEKSADFKHIDWGVMQLEQWGGQPEIKESRQAEFLVHDHFPWTAIEQIGVLNREIASKVAEILTPCTHRTAVTVEPSWYYP